MTIQEDGLNSVRDVLPLGGDRKVQHHLEEWLSGERPMVANFYGMSGMGKDHLLNQLAITFESAGIEHTGIIDIPTMPSEKNFVHIVRQIGTWVNKEILESGDKLSTNQHGLELNFQRIKGKLHEGKKGKPFAILVNNLHNLPFDDLDWFQSTVVESLREIPGVMIVLTSQNELTWHSWQARKECVQVKLPVFTQEKILELSQSAPLALKIHELSAGHPRTVLALVKRAKKFKTQLATITEEDVKALHEPLLNVLKREINADLSFGRKEKWPREIFYLTSAADGLDADLASDIATAFNKRISRDVTDIAWEMAYTGLFGWDFDKKIYQIPPELRDRIATYMLYVRKEDFVKALNTLTDSYIMRAQILPKPYRQILLSRQYFIQARVLEGQVDGIADDLRKKFEKAFEGDSILIGLARLACEDENFSQKLR